MTGGGGPNCIKLDKIILKKIRNVFKFFNIKVEKAAVNNIKTKYDMIIDDLLHCIKNIKGEITCKKVDALILKSKFMKKCLIRTYKIHLCIKLSISCIALMMVNASLRIEWAYWTVAKLTN